MNFVIIVESRDFQRIETFVISSSKTLLILPFKFIIPDEFNVLMVPVDSENESNSDEFHTMNARDF